MEVKLTSANLPTAQIHCFDLVPTLAPASDFPSSKVEKVPELRMQVRYNGKTDEPLIDDHYSPAKPQLYYEQRVLRHIEFYEKKLLPSQRCRTGMHVAMLMLAVASGIFAFFDAGTSRSFHATHTSVLDLNHACFLYWDRTPPPFKSCCKGHSASPRLFLSNCLTKVCTSRS